MPLALAIVIALAAAIVGMRVVQAVTSWVVRRIFKRFGWADPGHDPCRRIGRATGLFVAAAGLEASLPWLQLPDPYGAKTGLVLDVFASLFAVIAGWRLVDAVAEHLAHTTTKGSSTSKQLVPLLRRGLKILVVAIGIVVTLQRFDVNIAAVLAGLSIGGVAVALAAQDTIKNLFGAFTLMTDRPFVVGDWIVVQGAEGVVEDIGLRSTRLRTFSDSVVTISNGRLADMTIDNMGLRVMRRYRTFLGVTYDTPVDVLQQFVDRLHSFVRDHDRVVKDESKIFIAFFEFGDYALRIVFQVYFDVMTGVDEHRVRQEINIGIMRIAQEMGIDFAFPTQTIHSPAASSPFSQATES